MPLWSLTFEKVEELLMQNESKKEYLKKIEGISIKEMWLEDLLELEKVLDEVNAEEERARLNLPKTKGNCF